MTFYSLEKFLPRQVVNEHVPYNELHRTLALIAEPFHPGVLQDIAIRSA